MIGGFTRYGLSKLANVLFTQELQKLFDREGLKTCIVTSVHPGSIATSAFLSFFIFCCRTLFHVCSFSFHIAGAMRFMKEGDPLLATFGKPHQGALTPLFAAAHPAITSERDKYAGAYIVPLGDVPDLRGNARREGLGGDLWRISEEVVGPYRG